MRAFSPAHQAVIDALQRDLRATLAVALPSGFERGLLDCAEVVMKMHGPDDIDGFDKQFVDDIQQQVHDDSST